MPRLSVILPVRNGATTIDRAVRSTLRALPHDSELVVVDDGSTDASATIVQRITDPRLRMIAGPSAGLSSALNAGITATDSRVIARMDADDVCLPWRFKVQHPDLVTGRSAVFTTVLDWTPARWRIVPNAPLGISPSAFALHLVVTNPVSHPTLLCTRELIERVGGYRTLPAEDYDLWIRMQLAGASITRLSAPTLLYRLHPAQITASTTWRSSSWNDPLIGAEYRELTRTLIGRPFDRLNNAATSGRLDADEFERMLMDFHGRVQDAAGGLAPVERRFLLRKLVARVSAARSLRGRAPV